ncbi:MAG: glycosyl transferase [Spirochaetes bacterium]|nr:glycosyl transferase [Spirochaetota bacterium]
MNCGYFDHQKREYVITTPKTPTKWINYIGTLAFGGFVDQTGGGVICKGDPALNRITRYLTINPKSDFNGETLYVRTEQNGVQEIFSPFFTPCLKPAQSYECRVGLGYNRYKVVYGALHFDILIFVPFGASQVIRQIRVTNSGNKAVSVDLIPVVEYSHFDALKQLTNADWVPQTMGSRIIHQAGGLKILMQHAFMKKGVAENFFTSNIPVSSFSSDRNSFLGNSGYGSWACPGSLTDSDELDNREAVRGDNIGALMHHLGALKPGESRTLIVQLGQVSEVEQSLNLIETYRNPEEVEKAFGELEYFWDSYLDALQIQTPSDELDAMINVHNARQCYITKNWSRDLSLYQLGFGGRGLGFRDSSQDAMGILAGAPEEARELIEKILSVQKSDGSAMHQFFPQTMQATVGDSHEMPDRPKYYGDDHLWIVLAVCAYIKETGNFDFLEKSIPFYEKDGKGKVLESASIREHLGRAIEFSWNKRGAHGLPLLGFADWNDTINLKTGAESTMVAAMFGHAINELCDILETCGQKEQAVLYSGYYREMKQIYNDVAWDGEWFTRYFDHDGTPLGSHTNAKGKIFANAQSWAVISGFAEGQRARSAMESVYKHLNTKNGIKLSAPGYNGYNPAQGGVSTYPPGAKENGGIFLHSNPWVMIAETLLGNGDRAFDYYLQVNPAAKNDRIEQYEIEPYCYAQNILGDEHPQFGLGRNSWLSGTASWMYQTAVKHILGIRPACNGLVVDPCVPCSWKEFSVNRKFRDAEYAIQVCNPDGVSKGVKEIKVNGIRIKGQLIPQAAAGTVNTINVLMG